MGPTKVQIAPIRDEDVAEVAEYLHRRMTQRVAPEQWEQAMLAPWQHDPPNHGYLARAGGVVVGAYLALYSERLIRGRHVRICNLAAWCVDEEFRFSSVRLLKALLGQDGFHFVDLSPSGNVIALNRRLGFRDLDTATAVAPNLPWPTWPGHGRITSEPERIEAALTGADLQIYLDHATAPAAHHLLLTTPAGISHLIYRRDRRKGLPLFANILYASNRTVLSAMFPAVSRHLLLRHGIPALLAEQRITGCRPRLSRMVRAPRPKMFKSQELDAEDIDDLYSELIAVAW